MKKQTLAALAVLTLAGGLLMGGFGGYKIAKSTVPHAERSVTDILQPAQLEKNLYDGSNLTLSEMYDSLEGATGSDFDHKLLMYEIAIKQNESGMLRIAKEKSQKDSMKQYASIQMNQNDLVAKMLYGWQRQWGYSHH